MSIFSAILEKLGLGKKDKEEAAKPTAAPAKPAPKPAATPLKPTPTPQYQSVPAAPKPAVVAISVVDVVSKLDQMAKSNPQKLDWKVSIVDLLKLLGLDSSLAARKELATELHCPPEKIGGDYSEMNMWLHKEVLKKIAENGGNIPASLL